MTIKPQQPREIENPESSAMTDEPTILTNKKTRRPWDEKHRPFIHTYRNIPPELHQEILDIAKQLNVSAGEVMRALAEYGLAAYKNGDLILEPVPVIEKKTLFPGR
jgi:hypothetical protein